MIACKRKTVFERPGERVTLVSGHRDETLANIARRQYARLFTQNARRSTIVGHGNDSRCISFKGEQRTNRYGRARTATNDHGLYRRCRIVKCLRTYVLFKLRKRRRRRGIKRKRSSHYACTLASPVSSFCTDSAKGKSRCVTLTRYPRVRR